MRSLLSTLLFIFIGFFSGAAYADSAFIKIGVLNNQNMPNQKIIHQWEPTTDYLAMKLPGYDFEIVPLGFYEVESAVEQGKIDFILANPAIFVNLEARYKVIPMATMNNVIGEESYSVYAGVIFTKSGRNNINTLSDLKGKSFIAVNETSLGGFLMAWRELQKHNIHPYTDFSQLSFTDSHESVVGAIVTGKIDAGTVRTDTLEKLIQQGRINASHIKIINPIQSADFPLVRSTALYPEWPISRLQHTNKELAEKVTLTLLRMPSDFPSRFAGGYAKWTLPRNYEPVHDALKALKLPPYALTSRSTVSDALKQYWYWPLIGLLALIGLTITNSAVIRRNKRLEQAKQKLEQQYELIVNSVTDGIYGVDMNGQCTFVNQAMQNMTGWKPKDLLGKHLKPLIHHTRKDGTPATYEECPMFSSFADGKPHLISDDIFWKKNGNKIDVEYSSTPIRDQSGEMVGGVVVFRDISERKQTLEEQQQHELQLSHVSRLSLLGEIASGIAHELNQPLTAIATNSKACVRMLESSQPNIENCADVVEKIAGQAERAGEVIRHIRHFVHKEMPDFQPVSMQSMLDTVLDLLQGELKRHDIKLTLELSHPDHQVLAQEIQIEQVLINLVRNAIESVESQPADQRLITLSTKELDDDKLEIRVTDSGTGLDKIVEDQLFDPFVTTKMQGMGLGLSISQGIVEAHGDRIHVDSNDHGASFYFSLPLTGK